VRDPKGRSAAALVKDRFAKLIEDDYAELLKAAVDIWGVDDYRAHVPALYSRERPTPVKKPRRAVAARTANPRRSLARLVGPMLQQIVSIEVFCRCHASIIVIGIAK